MENQRQKKNYITVKLLFVKTELTAIEKATEKMATCYERQCYVCQQIIQVKTDATVCLYVHPPLIAYQSAEKYLLRMGTIFKK
jgi:hypothetical protein